MGVGRECESERWTHQGPGHPRGWVLELFLWTEALPCHESGWEAGLHFLSHLSFWKSRRGDTWCSPSSHGAHIPAPLDSGVSPGSRHCASSPGQAVVRFCLWSILVSLFLVKGRSSELLAHCICMFIHLWVFF